MTLRLHCFLPFTYANGPGCRAAIWFQGCSLRCPGCFNRLTHRKDQGYAVETAVLLQRIVQVSDQIEGVTFTGGEPLDQPAGLFHFLRQVRRSTSLSTILLTGYSWEQLHTKAATESFAEDWLTLLDVVIAGRYQARNRLARGLRGSSNKTVHFLTDRYTQKDIDAVPPAEVLVSPAGQITLTGVGPLTLRRKPTNASLCV